MNKLNKEKIFEINSEIIEYDIKNAGMSLSLEYELLPKHKLIKIQKHDKDKQKRILGLMQRKDIKYSRALVKAFDKIIQEFIDINAVDFKNDVISIKKDAVFIINKEILVDKFGTNIIFVKKNIYHAYLLIEKFEFYFNINGNIDVKGLHDSKVPLHKDGILYILKELVASCESDGLNKTIMHSFMKECMISYKKRQLPIECYREFNSESAFRVINEDESSVLIDNLTDKAFDEYGESLIIGYNYEKILLPLYRILCG